jgi:hypothetical protein
MSVTSSRIIGIGFTGDVDAPNLAYSAEVNVNSPGEIDNITLTNGTTSLAVPSNAKCITIVPPPDNIHRIILKGASGDTGLALQLVDPSSIAIYPTTSPNVLLTATTTAAIVRVIWS